jgi:hypothetical protein
MSDHSSGYFEISGRNFNPPSDGNTFTITTEGASKWWATSDTRSIGRRVYMNIAHTHNYDHKHNITADGGTEARPDNYTVRIWKRIA